MAGAYTTPSYTHGLPHVYNTFTVLLNTQIFTCLLGPKKKSGAMCFWGCTECLGTFVGGYKMPFYLNCKAWKINVYTVFGK